MLDAICLSDFHLGSRHCLGRPILKFLEKLPSSEWLYLNGDIFDSWNLTRMKAVHCKILTILRSLMQERRVIWLLGNHEGSADMASDLMGMPFIDHSVLDSGGKSFLVIHGHQFKGELGDSKVVSHFASLDDHGGFRATHHGPRRARPNRVRHEAEKLASSAVVYTAGEGYDGVLCGHTHYACTWAAKGVVYGNSGAWIAMRDVTTCTWLAVKDGIVNLRIFT